MSDYIPFEIQSEIIKMLPVKSLIQFRSVSKQWKAFIDNPEFIRNYTNPQHHLLVQYQLDNVQIFTSIFDNNTFPHQKFPLTAPLSLSSLSDTVTLGSVNGLVCFLGSYREGYSNNQMAVIWNPAIRKSVGVVIPKTGHMRTVFGFGACPDTRDPKLVKISFSKRPVVWEVDVFTLSTRVWKRVYTGAHIQPPDFTPLQVFVNGVIYFRAYDDIHLNPKFALNFVVSFDLKSEKLGDVCLPERLVHTTNRLDVAKVNESLGLLEYCVEGGVGAVCDVWSRKDGSDKPFTKIYSVNIEGKWWTTKTVLGFRNNGEVVMERMDEDANFKESRIEVYEPLSGHTIGVGISGKPCRFFASSYIETFLLLDVSDSIILHGFAIKL